jgi:hypothetical protein
MYSSASNGISNAIVSLVLFERRWLVVTQEAFLSISGIVLDVQDTVLVKAAKIEALRCGQLAAPKSRDFR